MKTYTEYEMQKLVGIEAVLATTAIAGKGIQELMIQCNLDEYDLPDGVFDDLKAALGRLANVQVALEKESQDVLGKENESND